MARPVDVELKRVRVALLAACQALHDAARIQCQEMDAGGVHYLITTARSLDTVSRNIHRRFTVQDYT